MKSKVILCTVLGFAAGATNPRVFGSITAWADHSAWTRSTARYDSTTDPERDAMKARCFDGRTIAGFAEPDFPSELESLRIYNSTVRTFGSIHVLRELKELRVRDCNLADISGLAELTNLSYLSLTDVKISDISPISKCKRLAWLDLRRNKINDISGLRGMHSLIRVDLRGNPLQGIAVEDDIRVAAANNPGADILVGPDLHVMSEIQQLLSAEAAVTDFAFGAQWRFARSPRIFRSCLPLCVMRCSY